MKNNKIASNTNLNYDFDKLSKDWWDINGTFKALHAYNFIRIEFIKKLITQKFDRSFPKINILDIGCGGGILCEPLAKLGFDVTGIDLSKKAIEVAKKHSKKNHLKINYINNSFFNYKFNKRFDIITGMEVLEHVDEIELFIQKVKKNLKNKGLFIGSTLNKTPNSYFLAILLAERFFGLLPKNTHKWENFIKPNNLKKILFLNYFSEINFQGVNYNPIVNSWKYSKNCNVNYLFSASTIS